MPLPDERPRQTVANLIGRFEQQVKRQASPAPPVVPRSSSVSSQIAGDTAKQEAKEKREWPPKTVASTDNKPVAPTLPNPPSPTMSKSPTLSPQPIPDEAPASPPSLPPASADAIPTPTPTSPEPTRSPPSKTKPISGKPTPSVASRRPVMSPAKSRSPVPTNPPAKSSVTSPPPKTSLQPSASQPIKPQHTGQSVTSSSGTARLVRTTPRTAPSTPSRPRLSAPQSQPITRPKTPSAGLFAPTASSLARSRNAPPPPPPVRKATISSDAAERLSKPTAASLSRARTPVPPAQTPARPVKFTSSSHGATPRGTPKAAHVPVKPKEAAVKQEVTPPAASASSEPSRDSDHPVDDHAANGHGMGTLAFSDGGSLDDTHAHSEVTTHDPAVTSEPAERHEPVLSESEVHHGQPVDEHPTEEAARVDEHVDQGGPKEGVTHNGAYLEVQQDSVSELIESHADEVISNGHGLKVEVIAPPAGNDIEDIVNLLEGASLSKARPQSIVSIPDEDVLDDY